MIFTKKKIGKIFIDGKIDVTDPCYARDVWCRMNDVEIKKGEYTAAVWMHGKTVGILGIYYGGIVPDVAKKELLGEIGVDAGLAGFVKAGTEIDRDEWPSFCDRIYASKKDAWLLDCGVVSVSGEGDGGYDVYAYRTNGEITAVEIYFL